jgi:hypothetical protein
VKIFVFDHCSALLPTTPIIFHAVVHNAEKLSALWVTTRQNTHQLKLEQFSALLPTKRRKIIGVAGNSLNIFPR